MIKKYSYLKSMMLAVKNVILFYAADWAGLPSFVSVNTLFNDKYDEISETLGVQQTDITGYTIEKSNTRKATGKVAVAISKKIKAYATDKKDAGLKKKMSLRLSQFVHGKANDALLKANLVAGAVKDMTAADKTAYGITAAQTSELSEAITNLEVALVLPRDKAVVRKTASDKLPKLFSEGEAILRDQLDGLMYNFEGSDFFDDYFNARIVVNQIRHTVIRGNVVDPAGKDLRRVKVQFIGKDKLGAEVLKFEEITDKDGNFAKSQLNPELSYDLEFVLPDFEPVKIENVDLKLGTTDKLEVVMVPK